MYCIKSCNEFKSCNDYLWSFESRNFIHISTVLHKIQSEHYQIPLIPRNTIKHCMPNNVLHWNIKILNLCKITLAPWRRRPHNPPIHSQQNVTLCVLPWHHASLRCHEIRPLFMYKRTTIPHGSKLARFF